MPTERDDFFDAAETREFLRLKSVRRLHDRAWRTRVGIPTHKVGRRSSSPARISLPGLNGAERTARCRDDDAVLAGLEGAAVKAPREGGA